MRVTALLRAEGFRVKFPRYERYRRTVQLARLESIGLEDTYHDLAFGPCTPEMLEAERGSRLVHGLSLCRGDHFDCTYAEWMEHFRAETHGFASSGAPMPAAEFEIPTMQGLEDATLTVLWKGTLLLRGGGRIERWGDRWAFVDSSGYYLRDVDDGSLEGVGDGEPSLTFATPIGWLRAHAKSEAIFAATTARRKAAGRLLKRDLKEADAPPERG